MAEQSHTAGSAATPRATSFGVVLGRESIAARLIVFAVVLTTLTATVVGSLSYTRSRQSLEREAQARLGLLARDVVEDFQRELEDRVADMANWAQLEIMRALRERDHDKALAKFFQQLLQGRDIYYRGIAAVDRDGRMVASAGDVGDVRIAAGPERPRIVLRPTGERGTELLQLEATVAEPDRPGDTTGTLVAIVEPLRLLRTAQSLIGAVGSHIGLSVRTRQGEVVVDTTASAFGDSRSGPVLQGTATMRPLAGADGPDLEAVVAEPAAVALAAIDALRTTLVRTAALVVAIASALGALVAWWISRPIRRLTASVRQIGSSPAAGDTPVVFPPAGGEIGVLTDAFQTMMASLADAQAEGLAQSRLAVLGEVAANVAHEVRTPLSVLKASAQLLDRDELPTAEARQLRALMATEVDRLNRVVTDLVDLARPRSPRYRHESMTAAVDRAIAFFAASAGRRGIELIGDLERADPLTVNGSADQLHQVLVNLLHNAMQALPGGGRAAVRARRDDGWIVVDVDDTGPGFASGVLDEPFARFHTTRSGGAGLGLVISRRIVEEHGGRIEALNLATGGARVRFRLPAIAEAS